MISLKVCKCSMKVRIFGAAMKLFKLVELEQLLHLQVPRNLSKTSGVIGDRCGVKKSQSS